MSAGRSLTRAVKPLRSEQAYDQLKTAILNNQIPAGQQILEKQISVELDVGRTPMREALVRLAQEGLIEIVPRHGFRVVPLDVEDMKEIYDVLTTLECMAVELMTQNALDATALCSMESCIAKMNEALSCDDLDAWAAADEQFHELLLDLCGNRCLSNMVRTVRDQSQRVRMATLPLREKPRQSAAEHKAVLDAVKAGDSQRARDLHYEHRQRVAQELVDIVAKTPVGRL